MKLTRYKLVELIDVRRGASLSGEYYATEGDLIRLTLGNFDYQGGGFKDNTSKNDLYFVGPVKQEFILSEGDIITPLTEQTPGLLGSTAQIPVSDKFIQSQDVALIIPDETKLDKDFCYYLLPSKIVKQQLAAGAQQTKIRHTTPDRIKDLTVFIPALEDQRSIGKLLKSIDRKIALNREINRNLEAMARQFYDYWFVQFDFPDENGRPYKSSGGKMVWNEKLKQEIPEDWTQTTIERYANIQNGATPSTSDDANYGGDIVWITPKDLSEQSQKFTFKGERFITTSGYSSCSTTLLPKGTVLMSSRAPIGLLSIAAVELCTNQGFKSLVSKHTHEQRFLYYLVQQYLPYIKQLGSGTTFSEVSKDDLAKLKVLYVPTHIIEQWDSKIKSLFYRQELLLKEIETLTKQREELLPLLMNGQVSVIPQEVNCDLSHD